MKFRILTTLFLSLFSLAGYAQLETAKKYADQIDKQRLETVLTVLASDEYGGRETGKESGIKAGNYVSDYLKNIKVMPGNKGSYFQDIEAFASTRVQGNISIDGFPFEREGSYQNYPTMDSILTTNQVIFAGYGIYSSSYNDFSGIDITDKVIMIMQGNPRSKFGVDVSSRSEVDKLYAKQKPKAIISIQEDFYSTSTYLSHDIFYYNQYNNKDNIKVSIPQIKVNELLANKILEQSGKTVKQMKYEIEAAGSPQSFIVDTDLSALGYVRYKDAQAKNIIGFIEGTDMKDEYLVLSAHYDHLGTRYNSDIYNGADDNASGVSALLEIANMFAKAKKEGKGPRRSIIFLFPTAEEKGLLGSQYYVTKPAYPLDKTIGCINLDMLGRISKEEKDNNYLNISRREKSNYDNTNPSGILPEILDRANSKTLNMKINVSDSYFSQSDHYNFVQKGVPGVMVTSGIHNDYHETTDDSDKIDYEGLHKRTQLIFYMAWTAANAIEIPKVTVDIDPRSSNNTGQGVVEVEEVQVLDRAASKHF